MKEKITALFEAFLKAIFGVIDESVKVPVPNEKPDNNPSGFFRNKAILIKVGSQIGVKEGSGSKENPQVQEYLSFGGSVSNKAKFSDATAWCAGLVGWVLEKCGMGSTNNLMARSYEKWGVSVKNDPLPGDIVTFWRTSLSSGFGHVGFFLKKAGDYVYIVGGNQSDEVNIAKMSTARMTDIRRSSLAGTYTEQQRNEIRLIAEQLMAGKKIDDSGKVV